MLHEPYSSEGLAIHKPGDVRRDASAGVGFLCGSAGHSPLWIQWSSIIAAAVFTEPSVMFSGLLSSMAAIACTSGALARSNVGALH